MRNDWHIFPDALSFIALTPQVSRRGIMWSFEINQQIDNTISFLIWNWIIQVVLMILSETSLSEENIETNCNLFPQEEKICTNLRIASCWWKRKRPLWEIIRHPKDLSSPDPIHFRNKAWSPYFPESIVAVPGCKGRFIILIHRRIDKSNHSSAVTVFKTKIRWLLEG